MLVEATDGKFALFQKNRRGDVLRTLLAYRHAQLKQGEAVAFAVVTKDDIEQATKELK
ncbi:hypothetical protein JG663_18600, partial [Vibrio cholerae]|nr:hypothetical protein [Vibrio cholerae]